MKILSAVLFVPLGNQLEGNGNGRWKPYFIAFHRGPQFFDIEPAHFFHFIRWATIAALSLGAKATHCRGWERPGLGGNVAYLFQADQRFFVYFPHDSVFQAFSRLDESGQSRKSPGW